jgi:DNA-directed RNA polymerase subunit RPC12/RpoP
MDETSRNDLKDYYKRVFVCLTCKLQYGSDHWEKKDSRYCPHCLLSNRELGKKA